MSRLAKNIIYNLIGQTLLLFLSFVAIKYIFNKLGEDVLGIIYFTAMINALITTISQMGGFAAIVREVSVYHESEPEYIRELIRTFSLFFWVLFLILAIAIYYYSPLIIEKWITLTFMDKEAAIFTLRTLGIASIVALPNSLYIALFRGIERMEFNNIIEVTTVTIQQAGIIVILYVGGNLYEVVYCYAIIYFLKTILYVGFSSRFFRSSALIPGWSLSVLKRNRKFMSRMMLSSLISTVYLNLDKVIISKLLPVGALGYYSVAQRLVRKGSMIPRAISQASYPNLSSIYGRNGESDLIYQYRKLQDVVCFGLVVIYGITLFAFLPVFTYMLNEEVARMLLVPTFLLCVGSYMLGTGLIPFYVSLAVGKPEIGMRTNFYILLINIPITILLIYFYGLVGAGLSFVSARVIGYIYGIRRTCRECLRIPVSEWYAHILKIVIFAALTYGVAWSVISFMGSYTLVNLSIGCVTSTAAFLIGSFFMIGEELRRSLLFYLECLRNMFVRRIRIRS